MAPEHGDLFAADAQADRMVDPARRTASLATRATRADYAPGFRHMLAVQVFRRESVQNLAGGAVAAVT